MYIVNMHGWMDAWICLYVCIRNAPTYDVYKMPIPPRSLRQARMRIELQHRRLGRGFPRNLQMVSYRISPNTNPGWWLGHPSEKYEFVNWDD